MGNYCLWLFWFSEDSQAKKLLMRRNKGYLIFLRGFSPFYRATFPGMAEPDGLPSMGSHRVGHD